MTYFRQMDRGTQTEEDDEMDIQIKDMDLWCLEDTIKKARRLLIKLITQKGIVEQMIHDDEDGS
jgi:hypothetical protein